jgi:hypothetical protein
VKTGEHVIAAVPVSLLGQPLIAVVCLALLKTVLEIRAPRLAETVGFASPSR